MAADDHFPSERAGFLRRLFRAGLMLAVMGGLALAVGFFWFASHVPVEEVVLDRDADGIVVLTGGSSRVADAIDLLAAGRGKRLLISGSRPGTTATEIARLLPGREKLIACCVDLDTAVNTVANALETRRWVHERGFRSLIVVTSSYHMPRSLAELGKQMPGVTLVPFPVVSDKLRNEPWWASAPTARLILSEYVKFIASQVRMRIEPFSAAIEIVGGSREAAKS